MSTDGKEIATESALESFVKTMKKDFLISIIIPVYNEEGNIVPLLAKLEPIVSTHPYEILFVDDGSTDKTIHNIKEEASKKPAIKLISFIRNFGHQKALTAGYQFAKGDAVISIDADLQDPPELILKLIEKWQEGYQVVYARRQERNDGFFKRTTAFLFYRILRFLSDTPIPQDVGDFRLLDKQVVEFLNKLPEHARFLRGLVAWGGYSSTFVYFKREKRLHGKTHYPLSKMIDFALDGLTSFTTKPLKIATYIGFISSMVGALGIIYALYTRFLLPHEFWVTGWTTIFVGTMFFGGVQLLTIGIIGEYIGKIYEEIQNRPLYLIKEKVNI